MTSSGVAWAAVAGVAFGFSQLANRGVNRRMDALRATTAMVTAMLVVLVMAVVVTGRAPSIRDLSFEAAGWFTGAVLVHFLVGWTLFAISQQRIGPSRTASVLSTNPVVAALAAALVIDQALRPATWIGVVAVTAGVGLVATSRLDVGGGRSWDVWAVLGATVMFSISPLFVAMGLEGFDGPLVGLTVGMMITVPLMHVVTRGITGRWARPGRDEGGWLVLGGIAAGLGITAQWTAFGLIPVGAVISLQQLSTPVVLLVGPSLLAAPREQATPRLLMGTALILGGSVLVAMFGRALA